MTAAADLLARCRALAVELTAGPAGTLTWEADADPPADLLEALTEHKGAVLDLLCPPWDQAEADARPPILWWRMRTGVVLSSVLMPTQMDEHKGAVRGYLRRHVPYGAEAWQGRPGGPWRPLSELPRAWGLGPVGAPPPTDEDDEGG
jgi:hypothetical protein